MLERAEDVTAPDLARGCQQAERNAGERRVHARLVHQVPEHHAARDVHGDRCHTPAHQSHPNGDHQGPEQVRYRQALDVEDSDDQDPAKVVDDRESQQEQLQPRWRATAEHRQHTQHERYVRRDRHPPSTCVLGPEVQREEDPRRNDHPPDSGQDRKRRGSRLTKLPHDQLSLDLQTHDEEEERHQGLVDPLAGVLAHLQRPRSERQRRLPDVVIAAWVEIGPEQPDDGRHEEDEASRGLPGNELLQRAARASDGAHGRRVPSTPARCRRDP